MTARTLPARHPFARLATAIRRWRIGLRLHRLSLEATSLQAQIDRHEVDLAWERLSAAQIAHAEAQVQLCRIGLRACDQAFAQLHRELLDLSH